MTDQDLIRRCVERAEGWEMSKAKIRIGNVVLYDDIDRQYVLDALAAQLVRQVDAMPYPVMIVCSKDGTTIVEPDHTHETMAGQGRTLNTLRAIDEFYRGQDDD